MKKTYFSLLLAALFTVIAHAQIKQVTDINTDGGSSITKPFVYNGVVYFEADSKDSTTVDGKRMLIGDELYVIKADGMVELFKDINIDTLDAGSPNSDPSNYIEFNGKLYFNANDGDNGAHDKELWVTDGTPEGTKLVFDVDPRPKKGSNPQHMFVFNNKLYFQANDGSSTQFWAYDGVTDPVKVTTLKDNTFATPQYAEVDEANGLVYFKATMTDNKAELHIMDTANTVTIIDINDGNHGLAFTGKVWNGKYIYQGDDGVNGDELWVSDGTVEGTQMIKDINPTGDSDPDNFVELDGKLYFIANPGTGKQLWVTDGTAEGTIKAVEPFVSGDAEIDEVTVFNNKIYFQATDGVNGLEPWVFDGSEAKMLKDLNVGGDSEPSNFTAAGDKLFFVANNGTDKVLYVTNGFEMGTIEVASAFETSVNPTNVTGSETVVVGDMVYFTGELESGDEFYKVDASTIKLDAPISLDGISSLTVYNGELIFEAEDANNTLDDELYKMAADGTISLLKDINTDPDDSSPRSDPKLFTEYKGLLYFQANGGDNTGVDQELFVTDGTTEGTKLVYDFDPRLKKGGLPMEFFIFKDTLYMYAKGGDNSQIWKYDGVNDPIQVTAERSGGYFNPFYPVVDTDKVWLKGINDESKYQLYIFDGTTATALTNNTVTAAYSKDGILFKGGFLFNGADEAKDKELWFSNATAEGTSVLKAINPTASSDPQDLTVFDGDAYFVATIDDKTQLWKTDATEAGTVPVYVPEATEDVEIENLMVVGDKLIFSALDGDDVALFEYKMEGVIKVAQLPEAPDDLYIHDNLLFFVANDTVWSTDGTAAFTNVVAADAYKGAKVAEKADGGEFVSNGSLLYFVSEEDGVDQILAIDAEKIARNVSNGIKDASVTKQISVYPNPTTGTINVPTELADASYRVFDLNMRTVAAGVFKNTQINLNLSKGIYILQVEKAGTKQVSKIIVE